MPKENSKTGKPHCRLYLSRQALALFKELRTLAGNSEWVLPGRGTLTKPFAHNALNKALNVSLQGQAIPAFTIHDLRRTASTLLHENGWASDVVEKALNHTIGGVRQVSTTELNTPSSGREMLQFLVGLSGQARANFDPAAFAAERAPYPAGVGLQSRCLAVDGPRGTSLAPSTSPLRSRIDPT